MKIQDAKYILNLEKRAFNSIMNQMCPLQINMLKVRHYFCIMSYSEILFIYLF